MTDEELWAAYLQGENGIGTIAQLRAVEREATRVEREACAKLIENFDEEDGAVSGRFILSAAIRARGAA